MSVSNKSVANTISTVAPDAPRVKSLNSDAVTQGSSTTISVKKVMPQVKKSAGPGFEEEHSTFYLSSLVETTTQKDVREYFSQFGEVRANKMAKMEDGSCKGYSKMSIWLKTNLAEEKGLNCTNIQCFLMIKHSILGNYIQVEEFFNKAMSKADRDREIVKCRICVLNIPPNGFKDKHLKQAFSMRYKTIKGAYVRENKSRTYKHGKKKGVAKNMDDLENQTKYGFVNFMTEKVKNEALRSKSIVVTYQGDTVLDSVDLEYYKSEEHSKEYTYCGKTEMDLGTEGYKHYEEENVSVARIDIKPFQPRFSKDPKKVKTRN